MTRRPVERLTLMELRGSVGRPDPEAALDDVTPVRALAQIAGQTLEKRTGVVPTRKPDARDGQLPGLPSANLHLARVDDDRKPIEIESAVHRCRQYTSYKRQVMAAFDTATCASCGNVA